MSKQSNIWVANLSGQGITEITGLQVIVNGTASRAVRARYPNGNPETSIFPDGWITDNTNWIQAQPEYNSTVIDIPLPQNYPGMFQNFYIGKRKSNSNYIVRKSVVHKSTDFKSILFYEEISTMK